MFIATEIAKPVVLVGKEHSVMLSNSIALLLNLRIVKSDYIGPMNSMNLELHFPGFYCRKNLDHFCRQ